MSGVAPTEEQLFFHNIFYPDALLHQHKADGAFDDVHAVHKQVNCDDVQPAEAGQAVGHRHGHSPGKAAVKQKCDERFAAGAQREILTVGKAVQRHTQRGHADQLGRKQADGLLGVVDAGDKGRTNGQRRAHNNAAGKAQGNHPPGGAAGTGQAVCAKLLANDDGCGVAQREEHFIKNLCNRVADVQRGHGLDAPHGIALQVHWK